MPRPALPVALATGLVLSGLTALAPPAAAVSPDVVISQVYGGGGNSGAPYANDFIELFNRGTAPVDLSGWSVQYASATGSSYARTALSGSIAPGAHYLVQEAPGANAAAALPTPDATGTLAMSATAGKVALGSAGAPAGSFRDLVGYGTAAPYEGTGPAPAPSTSRAIVRGGADTDDNAADFTTAAPAPRNSGSTPPPTDPPPADPPAAVCDATPVAVPAVQGRTGTSPYAGQTVTTRGVVTGDAAGLSGFFLQDPAGDGDPATSDGVFVFVPAASPFAAVDLSVGDEVALTGTVKEFGGLTEIDTLTALDRCRVLPVPAPTTYALPEPVDGDLERVEGMLVRIPTTLTVQQSFFLGRFGQLTLGSGGRRQQPTDLHPAGSPEAVALAADNARALIVLDDASSRQNPAPVPYLDASGTRRAGDTVPDLLGWVDSGGISSTSGVNGYRLQPSTPPAFTSSGRPAASEPVGGTLRAASFNVLNYFTDLADTSNSPFRGANTAEEFRRQKAKIVAAIAGLDADVVGLTEIQNKPGAAEDLVGGLNAVTAPGRWAVVADPANGFGGDAIRVTQIYRTDRVAPVGPSLSLPEPNAFTGNGRNPVAQAYRELATNAVTSLVINHFKSKGSCPSATASGAAGNTDAGDGQGCWNAVRLSQAEALAGFVGTVQAAAGDDDVLLVGDFNAYGEEDPIRALEAAGLVDLLQRSIGSEAYSYVFDGLSGRLDHALATPSLAAQATGATEWHINADEPSVIDYNTEFKPDDRWAPTPYRSSDHDPVLVGLGLAYVPPVVSVGDAAAVVEGGELAFTLSLSQPIGVPTSVQVTSSGSEHTAVAQRVTFPAGTTTATVRVPTTADAVDEGDEQVALTLSAPTGLQLGDATGTGTVYDDDTATVLVSGGTVLEGDRGTTPLPFTISLSTPSDRPVTVTYATHGGTATPSCDYVPLTGTLTLAAGQTTARVAVLVLGDRDKETDETVGLEVTGAGTALGTVLTDDGKPAKDPGC